MNLRKLISSLMSIFLLTGSFFALASSAKGRDSDHHETVTICHATSSNANPYVVNHPSKDGDVGGHDGHNGPIWFDGITVDWGDIIPPFDYGSHSHYPGKNWTDQGQAIFNNGCKIPPPPPVDVCPNIDGNQATVPDGYQLVDGQCVVIPPPVDLCPNLDGNQTTIPDGYEIVDGQCQLIPPPPTDVCLNIDGVQTTIPDGYESLTQGQCTLIVSPPTDLCPNIEGVQQVVPEGFHLNNDNQCIRDPVVPTCSENQHLVDNQCVDNTSGGGGSVSTSGGGGGFFTPPTPPTPPGQVLGSTDFGSGLQMPETPVPQTLPVTGLSVNVLEMLGALLLLSFLGFNVASGNKKLSPR